MIKSICCGNCSTIMRLLLLRWKLFSIIYIIRCHQPNPATNNLKRHKEVTAVFIKRIIKNKKTPHDLNSVLNAYVSQIKLSSADALYLTDLCHLQIK